MNKKIEQLKGEINLFDRPEGWRLGQYIFNFAEWLTTKGYNSNQSYRMADVFHIPDEEFIRLLKEYSEEIK